MPGELKFEATVGPVADNFIGTRLPAGARLVGRRSITARPS